MPDWLSSFPSTPSFYSWSYPILLLLPPPLSPSLIQFFLSWPVTSVQTLSVSQTSCGGPCERISTEHDVKRLNKANLHIKLGNLFRSYSHKNFPHLHTSKHLFQITSTSLYRSCAGCAGLKLVWLMLVWSGEFGLVCLNLFFLLASLM